MSIKEQVLKPRLIVLGAGGHGLVVAEAAMLCGEFALAGFLDASAEKIGKRLLGLPVLGSDELLEGSRTKDFDFFVIGIGGRAPYELRKRLFARAIASGLEPATIIHPSAVVSKFATLGAGTVALARAAVNVAATVGINVILNTASVVEHDCKVADDCHIAPGAVLTGGVVLEEQVLIGAGAVVLPYLTVGARAVVGAGAVVARSVLPDSVVTGVPAVSLSSRSGS